MITYEIFKKYLSKIVIKYKKMNDVDTALYKAGCTIDYPTCIDEAINLLELLVDDKSKWINYWVFELECGEKYYDGCVTIDDKNVPLKTIEDLWECITIDWRGDRG